MAGPELFVLTEFDFMKIFIQDPYGFFQRSLFQDPIFLLEENRFCFKDVSALVDFCRLNQVLIITNHIL
jgi:hypothetical protein